MKLPRALPHLEGTRGHVVGLVYLLLAAVTVAAIAGLIWSTGVDMFTNVPRTAAFGFRTWTGDTGPYVEGRSAAAQRAGLLDQDRIVAIGGMRLAADATEFEIGQHLARASGPTVSITARQKQGAERNIELPRVDRVWERPDPASGLPLWLVAVAQLAIAQMLCPFLILASLLLFRRRRKDPEAMLFAFAFLLICFGPGLFWWFPTLPVSDEVLLQFYVTGWIASFVAVAAFPDGRFVSRWGTGVVAGAVLLWVANLALFDGRERGLPQSLFTIYNISLALLGVTAGVAVVRRYQRTQAGPERQQIKWAVGGFCVTAAAVLAFILKQSYGPWGLGPVPYLARLGLSTMAALGLPAGLLISLLRYRLYDADAAISRSVSYGVLTIALLAIFAGSEKVIEALGEKYFGESMGALAGGLGAAVAAVLIVPLHHRFSHWAEKRFQKNLIELRRGLPLLVGDLRETATLDDVAEAVAKRVERGVHAARCALVVEGSVAASRHVPAAELDHWLRDWIPPTHEGLDCVRTDPLFPMRVPLEADGCGRVGWLLLGPRPDDSFYGKDEREALDEIADPIARAIAIVQQRERRQSAFETRIGMLEAAVARLLGRDPATAQLA
ncbi:MAG: hypothetical protein JWO25_3407 [Alphaproteobacteria bacterium]|nr:hypothetical protein [Alphaproteobacteria bacterium]